MSQQDITPGDALMRLGASSAEAIARVLDALAPGIVERGDVTVLPAGASPFTQIKAGTVATSVSYVDGASGANIFVLAPAAARALTSAIGTPAPEHGDDGEGVPAPLSELEFSAVAEVANQMMAAAAAATGVVLGQQVEISPPETRVLHEPEKAIGRWGTAPHATSTTFRIGGEPCRLIQLVPSAFVVRMVRAIDELAAEAASNGLQRPPASGAGGGNGAGGSASLREALGDVKLRVWAELGRTRLPLGKALSLPLGGVVDLDSAADAPVDIYVNGLIFGQGRLFVTEDGEWAVQLLEAADKALA
jgi:flagellar motor switch protein FliN/FliY